MRFDEGNIIFKNYELLDRLNMKSIIYYHRDRQK